MKIEENKILGRVLELCSADKNSKGLPRPRVGTLHLIEGYGIEGDKFAGDDVSKSVMVVGKQTYDLATSSGIELGVGSFGENILFDFDPHDLEIGTIFRVGQAVLEITQICSVCDHLSVFHKTLPKLVKNHRGLYCKILTSGIIDKNSIANLD